MCNKIEQAEFNFTEDQSQGSGNYRDLLYAKTPSEVQPDLPVNETDEGYSNWQESQRRRLRKISKEWGVPIGKYVEIELKNIPGVMKGKLSLQTPPQDPFDHTKEDLKLFLEEISFQLDSRRRIIPEFLSSEIGSLHIIKV